MSDLSFFINKILKMTEKRRQVGTFIIFPKSLLETFLSSFN
ncbi:hypothetical protein RT41_GL001177 [Lactococcus fujiensis JCM 16395]|uniref:Uncharacterized protein n=1 Tax=Lactococcus fujiensis JCM 16395 TaxID=1291764 RepID=A0A2A5RHW4_9LACT|nr:hypothetical protein RT41_GL001177 [Lactococcus fujiensis JCM 16395]